MTSSRNWCDVLSRGWIKQLQRRRLQSRRHQRRRQQLASVVTALQPKTVCLCLWICSNSRKQLCASQWIWKHQQQHHAMYRCILKMLRESWIHQSKQKWLCSKAAANVVAVWSLSIDICFQYCRPQSKPNARSRQPEYCVLRCVHAWTTARWTYCVFCALIIVTAVSD